jgi:predicted tellurium resistance membrane protein TerC
VEGSEKAQEYFAGYLLEQSLSIDNLFVFVLVFNYFKTPTVAQPKVRRASRAYSLQVAQHIACRSWVWVVFS